MRRAPGKRELEMASQLIESLSTDFDADKYRDEYREELVALIERRWTAREFQTAERITALSDFVFHARVRIKKTNHMPGQK